MWPNAQARMCNNECVYTCAKRHTLASLVMLNGHLFFYELYLNVRLCSKWQYTDTRCRVYLLPFLKVKQNRKKPKQKQRNVIQNNPVMVIRNE